MTRLWLNQYWPYLVLALVILGPLLVPGYVLTMDMVFVPHPPLPIEVNASYPFYAILHYLSYLVPGDVLQKIVLLSIFSLIGIGMHRFLSQLFDDKVSRPAIYVGALFYVVNPFVYERLMMGQFAVIGGYALLPFFALSLIRFLDSLAWRQLWRVVIWLLAISIVSIHTLVPAAVLAITLCGQALWQHRKREKYIGTLLRRISAGIAVIPVLSSYWLIPLLLGQNETAAALSGRGSSSGFATQGSVFTVLRLQGFWAEQKDLFLPVQQMTFLPIIGQVMLWAVMIVGAVTLWRRGRGIAVTYLTLIVVASLVAFGLVGLSAYREPHKIIILIAIGSAIFLCAGAQWLLKRPRFGHVNGIVVCALPLLVTPVLLWGGWNQLAARDYPSDWYVMNQRLKHIDQDKTVIFVPWHLYQRFSFSPRIMAHPAATFFDAHPVLVSDDPEFSGVQPLKHDSKKQEIGKLLHDRPVDIASRLGALGVGYVIFAHEPGYEEVEFITKQTEMHKVFTAGKLELYEVGVRS